MLFCDQMGRNLKWKEMVPYHEIHFHQSQDTIKKNFLHLLESQWNTKLNSSCKSSYITNRSNLKALCKYNPITYTQRHISYSVMMGYGKPQACCIKIMAETVPLNWKWDKDIIMSTIASTFFWNYYPGE